MLQRLKRSCSCWPDKKYHEMLLVGQFERKDTWQQFLPISFQRFFALKNSTNQNVWFELLKAHPNHIGHINKYQRPSEVLGEGWGSVKLLLCLAPMSSRKAYWFVIWPHESDICIPKPWRHQNEETASLPVTGVTEPGPALNSLATLKGVMTMGKRWR